MDMLKPLKSRVNDPISGSEVGRTRMRTTGSKQYRKTTIFLTRFNFPLGKNSAIRLQSRNLRHRRWNCKQCIMNAQTTASSKLKNYKEKKKEEWEKKEYKAQKRTLAKKKWQRLYSVTWIFCFRFHSFNTCILYECNFPENVGKKKEKKRNS